MPPCSCSTALPAAAAAAATPFVPRAPPPPPVDTMAPEVLLVESKAAVPCKEPRSCKCVEPLGCAVVGVVLVGFVAAPAPLPLVPPEVTVIVLARRTLLGVDEEEEAFFLVDAPGRCFLAPSTSMSAAKRVLLRSSSSSSSSSPSPAQLTPRLPPPLAFPTSASTMPAVFFNAARTRSSFWLRMTRRGGDLGKGGENFLCGFRRTACCCPPLPPRREAMATASGALADKSPSHNCCELGASLCEMPSWSQIKPRPSPFVSRSWPGGITRLGNFRLTHCHFWSRSMAKSYERPVEEFLVWFGGVWGCVCGDVQIVMASNEKK